MKSKILLLIFGIFLIGLVSSANVSYCCEKTTYNAWCQNDVAEKCDSNFQKSPSSCEATSYCELGVCIDSREGTCLENTAQKVCNEEGGVWQKGEIEDAPQCSLGCCLIGDQAAFVTQSSCKRLASLYGLGTNFRTDIKNELTCIATSTSEEKGACVFEKEYEKTCLLLTQKECANMGSKIDNSSTIKFHKDYLCSDESLGTNCGPSRKTTCVEGKDEVYFVDTCGNVANIYDAPKINDKEYWSKIKKDTESCGYSSSNADSSSCGNCDFYLGSTCRKFESSKDVRPLYGDNVCRDLSCEYEGKIYKHGEAWCADSKGIKENLPGSRAFRLVCYNSEVIIEPCTDFRQEICIQDEINGFKTAACRINQWQDCYAQTDKQDCENKDRRDCKWIQSSWVPKEGDAPGVIKSSGGTCIPEFAPGFDFWNSGNADEICPIASTQCTVVFEKKAGSKKCVKNCECLSGKWTEDMNNICTSLGDCGSKTNFIGVKGYHDEKAYYSKVAQ